MRLFFYYNPSCLTLKTAVMIVAYLRVSTCRQNPDNQKEEIRKFAQEKEFIIDKWVVEVVSGKLDKRERKLGNTLAKKRNGDT